ncbi:Transcriptional repressor MprA [compost metagenome]
MTNKLVAKGLIERIIPENDRRSVYLRITEEGRKIEGRMLEKYKELTRDLWADFSEQEIDLLLQSFEKMLCRFDVHESAT